MHGELFGQTKVQGTTNKLDLEDPNKVKPGVYHRNINTQSFANIFFPDKKFLYGFNLLLSHWFMPENFRFLDAFVKAKPKVIFLWRKNLLARLRSELIFKYDYGIITLEKLKTITPKVVEADCEKQILMIERIKREMISALGDDSVMIVYFEDLITDKSQQLITDVQKFLGVKVKKLELMPDISRSMAENREQAISIIDKVLKSRQLSKYENYPLYIDSPSSKRGIKQYIQNLFER
jgi:hypothetical protein